MYDAINKGFSHATGDIYAYINSDDFYVHEAFKKIAVTFEKYPEIQWIKGITSFVNENSKQNQPGVCYIYNQKWITIGIYGRNAYFIHQDSVFWKKELWKKIGGIDKKYKLAGDYYLWIQLSRFAPLWSINAVVSSFRKTTGQLSENMERYRMEQEQISKPRGFLNYKIKLFFWLVSKFLHPSYKPFFIFSYKILFRTRNKQYVELDEQSNPVIKEASSYKI